MFAESLVAQVGEAGGLQGHWAILPLTRLPPQLIFQVTPLSGHQWVVVLQISLPVILLDEALKYLSRNHMDGEWEAPSSPALPAGPQATEGQCQCQYLSVWDQLPLAQQVEDVKGLWWL